MAYTLYYSPGACSLAPHIALEEIGLLYSLALVSTDKGETRMPEFRGVNPKGRVPVLATEGFLLTEAPAILLYLAQRHPDAGLMPCPDDDGLARAVEWFNWLSGTVHAVAVRMIWRPEQFAQDDACHGSTVARGREHLLSAFSHIEGTLGGVEWAVGERYTVVDPYLLVFYRWGNRMNLDMEGSYPAWTRHAARLAARPAVQRALDQEGIAIS